MLSFLLILFGLSYIIGGASTSTTSCYNNNECLITQFCQPVYYKRGGRCEDCWKCCNFKDHFDQQCQNRCGCQDGMLCASDIECGEESLMYCHGGYCQSCATCNTSECKSTCQGFNRNPNASSITNKVAFYNYITRKYKGLDIKTLIEDPVGPLSTTCPHLYADSSSITLPGCPCPVHPNSQILKCPIGSSCMMSGIHNNEDDFLLVGNLLYLDGRCMPCSPGELCDKSGIIGPPPLCPQGVYCPTPVEKIPCPSGMFCPLGTHTPKTCDYRTLALREVVISLPDERIIDRLLYKADPFRGNMCPANTTLPITKCSPGYYCPDPSTMIKCPKGYFCRSQSILPTKCPLLTQCPPGTHAPAFSYIIIVFYLSFAGLSLVVFVYTRQKVHSELHRVLPTSTLPPIQNYAALIRPIKSLSYTNLTARPYDVTLHPWLWPNDGQFEVRSLNAIMGSSGCGKSTLIELLRGRVLSGVIGGLVNINDHEDKRTQLDLSTLHLPSQVSKLRQARSLIGFVPQDDILLPELSVKENLLFSSYLKLPAFRERKKHIEAIVTNVCANLGFDPKLQDRIVGSVDKRGVSGGQRKRVSIGMELVGLHPIILMDEPTSGLDASGSQQLLMFSKSLTQMGITIVAVVHQPRFSSFMLFDQVTLLSRYGIAFVGSPYKAIAYYEKALLASINIDDNPADVLMDLLTYGIKGEFSQNDQALAWKTDGARWVQVLKERYPLFDNMMRANLGYSDIISTGLCAAVPSDKSDLTPADIIRIFDRYDVPISASDAKIFITTYTRNDAFTSISLGRLQCVFRYTLQNASMDGKYDNILQKLELFSKVPRSIRLQTLNDDPIKHARIAALVTKFCSKLMKQAGIESRSSRSTQMILEREIVLVSLAIKAEHSVNQENAALLCRENNNAFDNHSSTESLLIIYQVAILYYRKLKTIFRSPWFIQLIIPSLAALIVGSIHGSTWNITSYASNTTMALACVGVLSMITHVRTFSLDKSFIRREIFNNLSLSGYYIAYTLVDLVWVFVVPLMYFLPYYYLTFPLTSFLQYYVIGCLVCWWSSGVAYILSASPLGLQWVSLIGVFIAIIFGAFINGLNPTISDANDSGIQKAILGASYNRWSMEYLLISELGKRQDVMPNTVYALSRKIGICGMESQIQPKNIKEVVAVLRELGLLDGQNEFSSMCSNYSMRAAAVLFAEGLGFRLFAFVMMWCTYDTLIQRIGAKLKASFTLGKQ